MYWATFSGRYGSQGATNRAALMSPPQSRYTPLRHGTIPKVPMLPPPHLFEEWRKKKVDTEAPPARPPLPLSRKKHLNTHSDQTLDEIGVSTLLRQRSLRLLHR